MGTLSAVKSGKSAVITDGNCTEHLHEIAAKGTLRPTSGDLKTSCSWLSLQEKIVACSMSIRINHFCPSWKDKEILKKGYLHPPS